MEKTNAGKRVVTSKDLDECFLDSYLSPHFFFFQMAFEDPDVQGIYLLTDGKPVSLWFIMPQNLRAVARIVLFSKQCACELSLDLLEVHILL